MHGPATSLASQITGQLRIGDALTEGEALRFTASPLFVAPELLQSVRAGDPLKAKHLDIRR
jgi:peptide chain release factor 3